MLIQQALHKPPSPQVSIYHLLASDTDGSFVSVTRVWDAFFDKNV